MGHAFLQVPISFLTAGRLAPPSSINGAIVVLEVNGTIFPSAAVGDRWYPLVV